jgi:hypothetical protein
MAPAHLYTLFHLSSTCSGVTDLIAMLQPYAFKVINARIIFTVIASIETY